MDNIKPCDTIVTLLTQVIFGIIIQIDYAITYTINKLRKQEYVSNAKMRGKRFDMSEINIQNLLKRAAMLEGEKDYGEALDLYNRILEVDPENEIAYKRRKAIKNNTLTIKREKFPLLGSGAVRYYFCLDGNKIDSQFFVANAAPQDYTLETTLGNHRITINEVGFSDNAVPKEILGYDFEVTQPQQTLYLRYTKSAHLHFTTLASEEGTKSGGCYVATAVYGSYDCPQVWTLRRFRDYTLAGSWYGRTFIHI